jgi:hypothetical protein
MHTPSKLVRTWLLAAAIAVVGVVAQMSPAEAARMIRGGGGGHWHGGGAHWHGGGNWHGHGCWNCGLGWGVAGFATGVAIGSGWPYYGYGYGYPYGYGYSSPYYAASYGNCHWVRRVHHTGHGTYVRRARVCH